MARITFEDVGMVFPDGTRAIEGVTLEIEDAEFLVLVGPSGSGKSTLLRMLAGLEEITAGNVIIGDRVVNDLAPKDRDIAMVFQNYALYPHLSVFDNMAFGLRLRKMPKEEIKSKVEEAALTLEIHELLERKPRALSGGQRQRVAMGRAIVREPSAFLMDEPLSNLDAKLRVQMRTFLGRLHARLRTTTVYVTHDQVEAMTLGHRVAVIRKGKLQQVDTPFGLYRDPLNMFVAGFIGSPAMNFIYVDLTEEGGKVKAIFADNVLELAESLLVERPAIRDYVGREVVMGVRPGHFEDSRVSPAEAGRTLDAKVDVVEVLGDEAFVHFNLPVRCVITPDIEELLADRGEDASSLGEETEITARVSMDEVVNPGDTLKLTVDTRKLYFFDPDTADHITGQR